MRQQTIRYQSTTIFDVMDAQGRSYAWLARQLGCSRSLLTKIKYGERTIPEWFPEKASAALGLPVATLFFDPVLHQSSNQVLESSPSSAEMEAASAA